MMHPSRVAVIWALVVAALMLVPAGALIEASGASLPAHATSLAAAVHPSDGGLISPFVNGMAAPWSLGKLR